ncbi:MAG TPA: twin-arginine translocation signal domain-containing protein [Arenibaculum sp.]|nr:twin-arginine translocation signal domain-containing protein [Arenibaculum sp.]
MSAAPSRRRFLAFAALPAAAAVAALGACGKKPERMEPPPGAAPSRFPRSYPNPRYEPKPDPEATEP